MTSPTTAVATAAEVRRRFLVLTALRWAPVGLLMPVLVLLPLERGLTLAQVGVAAAAQGVVVLALELPTGGFADAWGRRRVLVLAGVVGIASVVLLLLARDPAAFAVAFALQGAYRALDSGPLEAWFVDASLAADDAADIGRGLSRAGVVLGIAIASGSLAAGGIVLLGDLGPVDALAVPILVSLALQVLGLVGVLTLMGADGPAGGLRAAGRAARAAPRTIRDGIGLLRRSRVLLALVVVELFWGFGSIGYEGLFPVRLSDLLDDADRAAAVAGPAGAAAWLASAAGAALVPVLSRRLGVAPAAALLRVLQGAAVVAMGLVAGIVGVVLAFLVCYGAHGASNPAHMTLLHRQAEGPVRATVVSINSMAAQPAGALGAVALTALAGATSVGLAMVVAGVVLAAAAPLYLPAARHERVREPVTQ